MEPLGESPLLGDPKEPEEMEFERVSADDAGVNLGKAEVTSSCLTPPTPGHTQLQMIKGEILKARGKSGQSQECPWGAIPHQ